MQYPKFTGLLHRSSLSILVVAATLAGASRSAPIPIEQYGKVALQFEPNDGQTDTGVRFLARTETYSLFLADSSEAVMNLNGEVMTMRLAGARANAEATGAGKLSAVANYFIGNDPAKWRTNVPQFGRVEYKQVYPGIDLVYYGNRRELEYDFIVAPGADPSVIRLLYDGVKSLSLDERGDLVLNTAARQIKQHRPNVYQEINGKRVPIAVSYRLRSNEVTFDLAAYDRKLKLVIDPTLSYSTLLGNNGGDDAYGIAVDSTGAAYITGISSAAMFPFPGTPVTNHCFVLKMNSAGNAVAYTTFFGGSGTADSASAIAVDSSGSAYVTGIVNSANFPTVNPFQPAYKGNGDSFVLKLNPTGNAIVYSTYLGGTGAELGDLGKTIAVDSLGAAYVTGVTMSTDFPLRNAFQGSLHGSQNLFLTKLNPAGTDVAYSTYFGGGTEVHPSLAIDPSGAVALTGQVALQNLPVKNAFQPSFAGGNDIFVTRFDPSGSSLIYSTYMGGAYFDQAGGVAADASGAVYVTGSLQSSDFMSKPAGSFIAKIVPDGSAIAYFTSLSPSSTPAAVAVDSSGSAVVAGYVYHATGFPLVNPLISAINAQYGGNFVTKLDPFGAIFYSTFFDAGSGVNPVIDIAANDTGVYLTGVGRVPTQNPLQQSGDVFISKLTDAGNATTVNVTVAPASNDGNSNLSLTVDGQSFTGPHTFRWVAGSAHTVGAVSPQLPQPPTLIYTFQSWSDGGGITHSITVPTSDTAVTANFQVGVRLTLQSTPSGRGTIVVNPASASGYYALGTVVTVTATAFSGFAFIGWDPTDQFTGTGNPQTFTIVVPRTIIANFTENSCEFANPAPLAVGGAGGPGTFTLNSDSTTCTWTASAPTPWLRLRSATSGVSYAVSAFWADPNTTGSPRTGSFTFNNTTVSVMQDSSSTPRKLGFTPIVPCRIIDTRDTQRTGAFGPPFLAAGSIRTIPMTAGNCPLDWTATAYSINVTVVPHKGSLSYLTVWPAGEPQPYVSTLNSLDGRIVANAAIVRAGANQAISAFVTDDTDLIIDVNGFFSPAEVNQPAIFVPVTPCRITDTRDPAGTFGGPTLQAGESRTIPVQASNCGIPWWAQAYSVNFTVVPKGSLAYLTTWPAGRAIPLVSTLNSPNGAIVANAAIVPAGINGAISVFVSNQTDVVIDINGFFGYIYDVGSLSFYATTPCRISDTRNPVGAFGGPAMTAGQPRTYPIPSSTCGIPASAQAYSLNATAVPASPLAYLTLWPSGVAQPFVSTLNSLSGAIVANAAIVPAGTGGAVSAFATNPTDLVLDINGYFAP